MLITISQPFPCHVVRSCEEPLDDRVCGILLWVKLKEFLPFCGMRAAKIVYNCLIFL